MPALLLHAQSTRTTRPATKLISAIVLACVSVLSTNSVLAHGVTFKTTHTQPTDSAFHQSFLLPWKHKIHEESSGKVNLLITPSDSNKIDSAQLFQMVKERAADIVWLNISEPTNSFPKFSVFGLPLAGSTAEKASRALWAYVDEYDLAFREFAKMRLLAVSRHDAPLFHMREKQIASLSDLTGIRIAIPNSDASDLLTALGASPVVTQMPKMRETLESGKVDGVLLSWSSLTALKLEDLVKIHSALPAGSSLPYAEISALAMNRDAYRSLGADLKQALNNNSGANASALIGKVFDLSAQGTRQRAEERGETVTVLPADELAKWQDAAEAAIGLRIAELDARGLKGKPLVDKANELLAEFEQGK